MIVCFHHVSNVFQSESTLYVYLNVKELLARNKRHPWRLSDCNGTRTHDHLVRKRTLNPLPKLAQWLSCVVSTYLYGAFDYMFLSCLVRVLEWIHILYYLKLYIRIATSRSFSLSIFVLFISLMQLVNGAQFLNFISLFHVLALLLHQLLLQ